MYGAAWQEQVGPKRDWKSPPWSEENLSRQARQNESACGLAGEDRPEVRAWRIERGRGETALFECDRPALWRGQLF